ncbi:YncE family protein [Pendulispora rubella]
MVCPGHARSFLRRSVVSSLALFVGSSFAGSANADASFGSGSSGFTTFESGQVRPLALSPSGRLLFATNTPDNRLEVFEVRSNTLVHRSSVPTGLEPVAVAVRSENEVWVVNHLSDSVSIVSFDDPGHGRVVRTLHVGDEPRDIVFAGRGRAKAFITTAHRGQNAPYDPQLSTQGVGRADVWVFDANRPGDTLGGTPQAILNLFTDTPRALAVSTDGTTVYAAGFHSGNKTQTINEGFIPNGGEANGGLPAPNTNFQGIVQPEVGLIVRHNGANWVDELGRSWDSAVRFSLPDKDVFAIDATANPPVLRPGAFAGVGTVLFNMAVNPVSGKVYVSNTEAFNEVRFEGAGNFSGSSVRGHLHESRITVLGMGTVTPRHLNKHIDYGTCCAPVPNAETEKSLAFPQSMAVSADGRLLYVSALGSSKVGIFRTAELESDSFVPNEGDQIPVSGGGPTGLVLDDARQHLYVLTRFDNAISILDPASRREIAHVPMYNPEPLAVVRGRKFLYDARFSSAHGDSACASCHVFGDFDSLAWDLGNPDNPVVNNPGPFVGPPTTVDPNFHPMKGPMTTQSLRGMANHGPMHWRGDRTGGNDTPSAQPDSGSFDENAGFLKFNPAFADLVGRSEPIPDADMQSFTDFILQVTYPPNPIRALDDSLTADQKAGRDFFFGPPSLKGEFNCVACHKLDPQGNPGSSAPGFFGTAGESSFDCITQVLKIPHLRNQYQKVGMFGMAEAPFINPGNNEFLGDQVRGFGFSHDGSFDSVFRFVSLTAFTRGPGNPEGMPTGPEGDRTRRQLESFQLAFDSNLKPIVGQQVTLTARNKASASPRIDLLLARADAHDCDLVARTHLGRSESGFLYLGNGQFTTNHRGLPPVDEKLLRRAATSGGQAVTYTCVPPGSGIRIGLDRDSDGTWDGDEQDAATDPSDPASQP